MNSAALLLPFERVLAGQRIVVTGHTGFTGSWVTLWLSALGAHVVGYALAPDTEPSHYSSLEIGDEVESVIGDIRDYDKLRNTLVRTRPLCVLHLAAQPLVRRSYQEPLRTFDTNVMGTANVLEAAREAGSVRAIVCITTDKVYRNKEWPWSYREIDELGGKDPYSASKSAAEMVIASYASSFGPSNGSGTAIATARGGNIIGGGDWSEDRLIPDFVRAVVSGGTLALRYPSATRPWQHVLALSQGYLMLLAALLENPLHHARAWNFGPHESRRYSVQAIVDMLSQHWVRPAIEIGNASLPEAHALALDSALARNVLRWNPPWDTNRAITETARWYRSYYENPAATRMLSEGQLGQWRALAASIGED